MEAVRNRLLDEQIRCTTGKYGINGRRICLLCRETVPRRLHTGHVYCLRCNAEHEARIAAHSERILTEMARRAAVQRVPAGRVR